MNVQGNINTDGGDFIGRDKIIQNIVVVSSFLDFLKANQIIKDLHQNNNSEVLESIMQGKVNKELELPVAFAGDFLQKHVIPWIPTEPLSAVPYETEIPRLAAPLKSVFIERNYWEKVCVKSQLLNRDLLVSSLIRTLYTYLSESFFTSFSDVLRFEKIILHSTTDIWVRLHPDEWDFLLSKYLLVPKKKRENYFLALASFDLALNNIYSIYKLFVISTPNGEVALPFHLWQNKMCYRSFLVGIIMDLIRISTDFYEENRSWNDLANLLTRPSE